MVDETGSADVDVGLLALELTAGGADDVEQVVSAAEEGNLEVWGLEYV